MHFRKFEIISSGECLVVPSDIISHVCGFMQLQSSFLQTHKVGNVGIIANSVLPLICSFLVYLH